MSKGLGSATLLLGLLLSCSAPANDAVDDTATTAEPYVFVHPDDPWEKWNRKVYAFNDAVDRYALKPAAQSYRFVTPKWFRTIVLNVFRNVKEVPEGVHHILQWEWREAGHSFGRFGMNTTFGVLGMFDPASDIGLRRYPEDWDTTFAKWGVGEGPYVMLPFLGPNTVRSTFSLVPDHYSSPRRLIEHDLTRWSVTGVNVLAIREDLLDLERAVQGDRYSFIRDFYLAAKRLESGNTAFDDFGSELGVDEEADWGDDDAW